MTIELKVPFKNRKDARALQSFLQENECTSKIVIEPSFEETVEYSASIKVFEKFLSDNANSNRDDEALRSWVTLVKECIEKIYSEYEIDVPYSYQSDFQEKICNITPEFFEVGDVKKITEDEIYHKVKSVEKISVVNSSIRCLIENKCAMDINGRGTVVILTRKKAVDKLVLTTMEKGMFDAFEPQMMHDAGIMMRLITSIDYQYVVVIGPKFLRVSPNDIIRHFVSSGWPSSKLESFLNTLRSKITFIQRVLDLLDEGSPTLLELKEKLSHSDSERPIVYHVSDKYLQGVLDDLITAGLIREKRCSK